MTQTQVFTYSVYQTDYITSYLRDHDEEIPDWFKTYLLGTSTTDQNRDDDLEDYLSAQTYVPSLSVRMTSGQSVGSTTNDPIAFEQIEFQSTSQFTWTLSDPTKLYVQESGILLIVGNVSYASSAAGDYRTAQLWINGLDVGGGTTVGTLGGNGDPQAPAVTGYSALANDYIQLIANQNTGGALTAKTGKLFVSFLGKDGG